MLNSTCQFQEPLFIDGLHWLTSFISIPVYGIAFMVLLFKCPKYFSEYRNYVIIHIISGVLQDFHLRVTWKLSVPLPWAAMCSNGFLAEYIVHSFQVFIFLLCFTGATTISLFVYRMEQATKHMENLKFQIFVLFLHKLYFVISVVVSTLTVLIYQDLKNQRGYKEEMEQKRGPFPSYLWCDNCFFMQFASKVFIIFYTMGYCCVVCALVCGVLAAVETLRALNSNNARLSARTKAIQKNFMFSLILAFSVHIVLLFVPLIMFFIANVTVIDNEYLAPLLLLLLQNHGSGSTFTLIITNNLLRKATKKLFLIPENLLRRSEPKIFERKKRKENNNNSSGVHVLAS